MRPDKKKVVDEVWDEARILSFLDKQPMGDEAADYSILLNAYRSMRPSDFEIFVGFYQASGRSLEATSSLGETLMDTMSGHRKSAPFLAILKASLSPSGA